MSVTISKELAAKIRELSGIRDVLGEAFTERRPDFFQVLERHNQLRAELAPVIGPLVHFLDEAGLLDIHEIEFDADDGDVTTNL